jgi:hypothetical protein
MTLDTEALGLGIPQDGHAAYRLGLARARIDARTEAFAAIRRAAAQARIYQSDAYWDVTTQTATRIPSPDDPCLICAEVIRDAIRAAIGSDKA